MNHPEAWIWVFIPITAIVMGIFGGIAKRYLRLKERQLEASSQMTAEKAAQYAAHSERLEQRVRVLERIVTDKGIDVADEIERLRDDRVN
jgi:ABC-type phosphate transport system auxiliary subunit